MGQPAVQKANSPQVKQFAQRMVTDHTHANEELMQLAKAQNTDLCPARRQAQSELDQLRGANGPAFATIDTGSGLNVTRIAEMADSPPIQNFPRVD